MTADDLIPHREDWQEHYDESIMFSTSTLAGVAHLPTDLNTQQIDYSRTSESGSTPSAAPEFDSYQEEVMEDGDE